MGDPAALEAAALAWLRDNAVHRGQWCGSDGLRSALPTMTFGTHRAAAHYASIPNDRDLARDQHISPAIFTARLAATRVYCRTQLAHCDPFFDLDVLMNDFGRDLVEAVVRTCADSIRNTNAFEEMHAETGLSLDAMVAAYPDKLAWLPPVDAHIALREPAMIAALQAAGYDAVAIGGSGETHGEMEWHVLDPMMAVDAVTGVPLPLHADETTPDFAI